MKKFTTLSLCFIMAMTMFSINSTYAQEKVSERKLMGKWKMVIEVEEALEEAEEELDNEDEWFASAIVQGVSGLVTGIMDNIEIYFEFRENGEVKVIVEAFGEEEIEWAEWEIENGRLYISDTDNFDVGDDDYWMMDGNILVSFESDGRYDEENENVYMRRVD